MRYGHDGYVLKSVVRGISEHADIALIKAKKSLGQNFLVDRQVARRIVDRVSPQSDDLIIEIGPGTGALTRLIAESSRHVVAVEIDSRLVEELRNSIADEKVSIIEADALDVNWEELISASTKRLRKHGYRDESLPRTRVVANLPYYISTPIIERLIEARRMIFDMTLMLQSEVVDRITSEPDSRQYGYLSVCVQLYCEARKLFEVPPSAFRPVPKVRSAVIRLAVRDHSPIEVADESEFLKVVRAAFAQRRKTIFNNLKSASHSRSFSCPIEAALERSNIDPKRRAETLSLAEFAALYNALCSV